MALNSISPKIHEGLAEFASLNLQKQAVKVIAGYTKPTAKNFAEIFAYRFVEFFKSIFKQSDFQKLRRDTRKELQNDPDIKNMRKSDQKKLIKKTYKMLITGNSLLVHKVENAKAEKIMKGLVDSMDKATKKAEKHALKV